MSINKDFKYTHDFYRIFFLTDISCLETYVSAPPLKMFTSSPGCQNRTVKSSKSSRQLQSVALCVRPNKALQRLTKSPDDCKQTFFNTANFHRFHVFLFKIFSPQLIDQHDSDSVISTLVLASPIKIASSTQFMDKLFLMLKN